MKHTTEERAAIAAYPESQVQRIPRGVSGEPEFSGMSWKEIRTKRQKINGRIEARNRKFQRAAEKRGKR